MSYSVELPQIPPPQTPNLRTCARLTDCRGINWPEYESFGIIRDQRRLIGSDCLVVACWTFHGCDCHENKIAAAN